MSAANDLFPGFESRRIATSAAEIFVRIGGSGPPVVLLHGYPQTHAIWHKMAPELAKRFTLILPDLRGYGQSLGPPSDPEHTAYSKRAMARDIVEVMRSLDHERFALGAHDRGARVAYRLALDHPDVVARLIILDVVPTVDAWQAMAAQEALDTYHWPFLAQPAPLPETLIAGAPEFYVDHTLASWSATNDLTPFAPAALAQYRALLANPESRHAACEDYRAGATCDWQHDKADKEAGRKIACPTLVLWGTDYLSQTPDQSTLDVWRPWCTDVRGSTIRSGHFLAEENPVDTLDHMLHFLEQYQGAT